MINSSIKYTSSIDFDKKDSEPEYEFYNPEYAETEDAEETENIPDLEIPQGTLDFVEGYKKMMEVPEETEEIPKDKSTDFISRMSDLYREELIKRNINPEYAKRLAIQDALETGRNGEHVIGQTFNYGNITVPEAYKDRYKWVYGGDKDAKGNPIRQRFRSFSSIAEYIKTKLDLLSGSRYNAFGGTPEDFFIRVGQGGYAESPKYIENLNSLYKQIYGAKNGMKLPGFENDFHINIPRGLKIK